ncbi:MAG: F0F1 ATP synthase subunit B [SAR202 cluster bacterium]|jgi:F-type H+-transporting ATPase subunit b|nr:F0F1 ATP synthase subunit B [SAR202 cluster bacterium]MDP6301406.1 F0F1 ATP synthase subunit B [SAR202 cluster bacterium]MDP7226107.1 F0F1 ATP synthase subunit B [SAR202 cluster bacterium]MDP7412860.1 F0F1 ATP synthase subunit B [SAR202 cluster bacterium]|tara:strand:- start:2204 stop:2710 length:507 start_codon:yes stop_codon:yes gene_type:complete
MEALGITLSGLVTQIVSFVILFVVLWKLLYGPVIRVLDQRSERIRESLEASQRAQEEAATSRQEMEARLNEARSEGQELIAQAREVADRFREEELAKAREDIAGERTRAQANIQRERDAAIEDLRREFAGLAIVAAERMIDRSLDEAAHRDLIQQVLDEGAEVGGSRY